ncbi:MAG: hypothetical protein HYT98_05290 [Candidatus Sungbacteria bacterium]|nr:hypothetical protein [Candidatus Sungbacteria bacterium]
MKYPWVSLSILGIWIATAMIVAGRADVAAEWVLAISLITTVVVAYVGFKSPE